MGLTSHKELTVGLMPHQPREGNFSGQLPFDARVFFHTHFCNVLASRSVIAGEQAILHPTQSHLPDTGPTRETPSKPT